MKVMIERSIVDGGVVPCMWHGVVIIRPSARLGIRLKSRLMHDKSWRSDR